MPTAKPCPPVTRRRPPPALLLGLVAALVLGACSSSDDDDSPSTSESAADGPSDCPTRVDADRFTSAEELRDLAAEFNDFGMRSPASDQHEASLDWIADLLAEVPGMEVEWDEFTIDRWQPTTEAPGETPGRDLAEAGGLVVTTDDGEEEVPVIGAVPFSLPTDDDGATGELVHIPEDEEVTPDNAEGRIVVREVPTSVLPYDVFEDISHYLTDDLPEEGDYDRPYLRPLNELLIEAGQAGAAGLIMVWDAPTDQLRGYWDPHTGTRFQVPSVFLGSDEADRILALADEGASARIDVRAEWDEAPTRNLIATLPGQSDERIVVNTNTDSVTWIQENGVIAAVALARYFGDLPEECRARTIEFGLTSNHLGLVTDGAARYSEQLQEDLEEDGTVAFVMVPEHLGAREILPAEDGRLEYTGEGDTLAWSAPPESPTLVDASVEAVEGRDLDRTAVLEGVGVPDEEQVPSICSQGGLGTVFHSMLIPTIAAISGPWSLWAPEFGEEAVDFDRLRDQTLALGDVAIALDEVPREEIEGGYPEARQRRDEGARSCLDGEGPPAVAPGPGESVDD